MYSSLRIGGYRSLTSFQLNELGHVNLLVGTNNSGKTSILECIELLRSAGNPYVITSILARRGERAYASDESKSSHYSINHLFSNRDLGRTIDIGAERADNVEIRNWNNRVTVSVQKPKIERLDLGDEHHSTLDEDEELILTVNWANAKNEFRTGIMLEGYMVWPRRIFRPRNDSEQPVQFIRTGGMTPVDIMRLFDDIVLTENEEHVIHALQIIDTAIERIASVSTERGPYYREGPGGVYLKLSGAEGRIPIGSAGDGMWRMLGLALALANARGGVILVDEIDTGLHYSVMRDMWRMVMERALALNLQVFATTHSRDCYESLAEVLQSRSFSSSVTIQRIDAERQRAIAFRNDEIIAAADRGIEIR